MKLSTRELVIVATFGTLWSLVEVGLGGALKALRVPASGLVLGCLALGIALTGRRFVPRRGAILYMGIIAALVKLFSLSSIVLGPVIAILSEALIAELVLSVSRRPGRGLFLLAGAFGVVWSLVQPLVTNPLLFGRSLATTWASLVSQGSRLLGLDSGAVLVIAAGTLGLYLLAGLVSGWLAWSVGGLVQKRLGMPEPRQAVSGGMSGR